MAKFIEIHNHIINIESISGAKFISDDIYLGLFPTGKDGQILVDMVPFSYGTVELMSGEIIEMQLDLYPPSEDETEDGWFKRNRAYINASWEDLKSILGNIPQIGGYEYL